MCVCVCVCVMMEKEGAMRTFRFEKKKSPGKLNQFVHIVATDLRKRMGRRDPADLKMSNSFDSSRKGVGRCGDGSFLAKVIFFVYCSDLKKSH